jgi:cytoskeleton protein RodZ
MLAITIGGRPVAKLGETETTIRDVPVTAEALLARAAPPPPPGTGPQAAPAPTPAT